MANSTVYTSAAVLFVIVVLFSITIILNSVDKSKLLATPGIPIEKATRSSFGSSTIHASVDEVFSVLMNFKDYNKWSLLKDYRWEDTTADGVPLVGSEGSVEVSDITSSCRSSYSSCPSSPVCGKANGFSDISGGFHPEKTSSQVHST